MVMKTYEDNLGWDGMGVGGGWKIEVAGGGV